MKENYYKHIGLYYDQDAGDYDSRYWSNPVLQRMRQSFRETVKEYPAQTMLEIGYGTGIDLVHFALTHPERNIYGIDISAEMFRIASEKTHRMGLKNVQLKKGSVEDIPDLFSGVQFDLIYIFFGALNTTADIKEAGKIISRSLSPGGILVLSFVNKWYLPGTGIELLKLNFRKAFARLKPVWGGYSPSHFLASYCYTPKQIVRSLNELTPVKMRGYCILHPAWYYIRINQLIRSAGKFLWKADSLLNKTFLGRFGEYVMLVFKK